MSGSSMSRRAFMGGCIAAGSLAAGLQASPAPRRRRLVLIAGPDSHGFGEHEHAAGCKLLARHLKQATDQLDVDVVTGGWPASDDSIRSADAVIIYADGGDAHPMKGRQATLDAVAKRGAGLGFIHYALIPPERSDYSRMLDWIGGYYESDWSVNPFWTADFAAHPDHPIAHGIKPFAIRDEWYFHMRFRDGLEGVTPLLTALPPAESLQRPDGPHSNNPHVREAVLKRREPQHVAWAYERPRGGRGFGFTGAHVHWNWAHGPFRTFLLNASAWLAGVKIPPGGLRSMAPGLDELFGDLRPPPDNWKRAEVAKMLAAWRRED